MLASQALRGTTFGRLYRPLRSHVTPQKRSHASPTGQFQKAKFTPQLASRAYSTTQEKVAPVGFASLFAKKEPLKCRIKISMKINNTATPQAIFPGSGSHITLDSNLDTILVMSRKQPATLKLLRAISGLQKKPVVVKHYATEVGAKPERRRKKRTKSFSPFVAIMIYCFSLEIGLPISPIMQLSKWLASMYGGDASDDALEKSSHAVNVAMACNLVCFAGKLGAFAYTGSASLFSEAVHSLADLANQVLLAMGINRSKRGPSEKHPFGSGNERYVWGLASAVSLFFVGAGASIYHGVAALYDPPVLESLDWALYILLFSAVLEGISIWVAMEAVRQGAKDNGMTFWQYCVNGPDPMGVAVLLEDGAAMAGLVIAGACTGLSYLFGTPIFDAVGSIMIGGLLGVAASFLINKNSSALLGQSMPASKFNMIMETLRNDHVITDIKAAKGIMIGADVATFSAEVDFDYKVFVESYLARFPAADLHARISTTEDVTALLSDFCNHIFTDLGVQINRLEEKIHATVPEVQFVDIEVN